MDALAPMLMTFLEQQARPAVQSKVTEQLDSTKGDLKSSLPNTIMSYLSGSDGNGGGNAMISQLMSSLGPNFMSKVSSVTGSTVDTASEGMDTLLTNGVMNIAKTVLTSNAGGAQAEGAGGFNFDFLSAGKDGMVNQTMAASTPVIKQVSDNMSKKLSSSIPASIAGAIQQMMDKNGGAAGGALGMVAGLMSKFMTGDGSGDHTVNGGGNEADIQATGGSTGGIQQMLQNLLAPKILLLIQPYMQKFEAQMSSTLENELRSKVFSSDYIKQAVMGMLTGGNGQGGGASALLGGVMNTFMNGSSQGGQQGGNGQNAALGAMANMAGQFLKNRG